MESHKVVMGIGMALFAVMGVLMAVGTTSLPLFITYGVLAVAGALVAATGQKMRDRR